MTIHIYTTPRCGFCQQLKKLLEEKQIPYTALDITSDAKALEEMSTLAPGNMSVPLTVIEKGTPSQKMAIGFDEAKKMLRLEDSLTDNKSWETALLTCPQCGGKQEEKIPTSACVPSYVCNVCDKTVKAEGDACCVFCLYADRPCPLKKQ